MDANTVGVIIAAVTLIFAVIVQTGVVVWYMSRLGARVDRLEIDIANQGSFSNRIVKTETILEIVQRQQDEQIIRLDKLIELANTTVRRNVAVDHGAFRG